MDTSAIIWIFVGVIVVIAVIAVVAWLATRGRRRKAHEEARRRDAERLREQAAQTDAAAREREVKAMQSDAAARQAQAQAAQAQLDADRLSGAEREQRSGAEQLRAEQAEHERRAEELDPSTDEHGNPLTHPRADDTNGSTDSRSPDMSNDDSGDVDRGAAPRHSRGV